MTKIKERPISLKNEEILAILDGRKTQVRRPCKVQPSRNDNAILWTVMSSTEKGRKGKKHWGSGVVRADVPEWMDDKYFTCPFDKPGGRLWVRETFKHEGEAEPEHIGRCRYRATDEPFYIGMKWTPSIHMPRWASRITLEVERIWFERVQDISENEAIAEGIQKTHLPYAGAYGVNVWHLGKWPTLVMSEDGPRQAYRAFWDKMYGHKKTANGGHFRNCWTNNPWVWCCKFNVL